MAQKRMFSLKVVDTDSFLDMPTSSQLLYFHLAMRGDDDGFVSNPKKITRMLGSNDDDYKVLIAKKFVIPFESGVCVIKHWRIHNYLQNDRYTETQYIKEKELLIVDEKTKKYSLISGKEAKCIQNVYKMYPQHNLTKHNLTKQSIEREQQVATPSKIADDFFNNTKSDYREKFLNKFTNNKEQSEEIKNEMLKFISYWTEPTKNGQKQRWQTQKTFEVGRRLNTWISRSNNFGNNKPRFINLDNI